MIKFENVSKIYQSGDKKVYALNKVSFEVNKGDFVIILGPSGAGKSTLLNILGGIDHLDEGKVIVENEIISNKKENELSKYRANQVGFIFQFYNLIPTLTVYENVALMKELKKDILPVDEILNRVGLLDHKNKFPNQLSGGQQQRVSIARAVVKNPEILLCDEPTGALDSETGIMVLKLLHDVCKEYKKTTIIVTHNANLQAVGDKVIKVRNGQISDFIINEHPLDIMEVEW